MIPESESECSYSVLQELASGAQVLEEVRGRSPRITLTQGQRWQLIRLLAHDQDGNAPFTGFIQLDEEKTLPSAKLKPAVGNVEHDGRGQEKRFAMGMSIGWFIRGNVCAAAEIVVFVFAVARHVSIQQSFQVFDQQGLVFVDDQRRRGVFGLHVDHSMADAGAGDDAFNMRCQINEFQALGGLQADHIVMRA